MDFIVPTQNESKSKHTRRQAMMRLTFQLAVEKGIRNINIPLIMEGVQMEIRSFYNYYKSLDELLEDIMMFCMREFYRFDYLDFSKTTNLYSFFHTLGSQFTNRAFNHKSIVLFLEDFDHHINNAYISDRYNQFMWEVLNIPLTAMQINPLINQYAIEMGSARFYESIKFFISTIFTYLSRLIWREDIYLNNVALLSRQGLDDLIEHLSFALTNQKNKAVDRQ